MKRILENNNESVNFSVLSFDVLNDNDMLKVRGGIEPKTREKDIYEIEEE